MGHGIPAARTASTAAGHRSRRPELRFLLRFTLLAALLELLLVGCADQTRWYDAYLSWNARWSAELTRSLGLEVRDQGRTLVTGSRTAKIVRSCDALEPAAFFAIAVLLFPAGWRRKAVALGVGIPLIQGLNFVRIASLLLALAHYPAWFEPLHLGVWPAAMILFVFAAWAAWALSVGSSNERSSPLSG